MILKKDTETNFEKVSKLNQLIGNKKTNYKEFDATGLRAQIDLIREEFEELESALEEEDWEELKDGVADVLVTTYGLGYRMDIDVDLLMEYVQDSNLSKFCTADEIQDTVVHYNKHKVEVVIKPTGTDNDEGEPLYAIVSSKDQMYNKNGVVKMLGKGKLLKNINWFEPDLDVENEID